MIKTCLAVILCFFSLSLFAQRGDELMVYAVKGKVTALYQQQETAVRIGKVLLPGSVIKIEKHANLTMLCTRGQAIVVEKEGSFPVNKWKDSCRVKQQSLTSNFFKYIWGQLYAYSPEHKEEMRKRNDMAVSRGGPPAAPGIKFTKLEFSKGMDTLNYDGTAFNLAWKGSGYKGVYHFTLYDAKGMVVVFKDSLKKGFIPVENFSHLLEPGKSYRWTIYAKGAPISRKRVLNYVSVEETSGVKDILLQPLPIPEDSATTSFRVAYLLEQRHFLAEAFRWYMKASLQNPDMELFRDQLTRFRNDYWMR